MNVVVSGVFSRNIPLVSGKRERDLKETLCVNSGPNTGPFSSNIFCVSGHKIMSLYKLYREHVA